MARIVAVIVGLVVFLFLVAALSGVETKVHLEFGVAWAMKAAGGLIAVIAAAALLLQCFAAAPTLGRLSPFVFALLGGLALVSAHWSAVLALAGLGAMVVAKEMVMVRAHGAPSGGPPGSGEGSASP